MKKIIFLGATAVVIGGLAYYPTYRAPKAHELIQNQLNTIDQKLQAQNYGKLKVLNHTTDKKGSHIELEVDLNMPQEYRTGSIPESITVQSTLDIDFGFFPHVKGFKNVHSHTTSKEVNELLKKSGADQELAMDCDTVPHDKGYQSTCATNELLFKNNQQDTDASKVETIAISASDLNIMSLTGDDQFKLDWSLPEITVKDQKQTLAKVEALSINMTTPVDPSGEVSLQDSLMGYKLLEGQSHNTITLKSLTMPSTEGKDSINLSDITFNSESTIADNLLSGDATFSIAKMENLPLDFKSMEYKFHMSDIQADSFSKVMDIIRTANETSGTPNMDDKQKAEFIDATSAILAKGPKLNATFQLDQSSDNTLNMKMQAFLKQSDQEQVKQLLTDIMQPAQPMAPGGKGFEYFVNNGEFSIDCDVDKDFAYYLAAFVASEESKRLGHEQPSTPIPHEKFDPAQYNDLAQQSLAMVEAMGIIEKTVEGFKSRFEVSKNGILLNGQDVSQMFSLPAASNP